MCILGSILLFLAEIVEIDVAEGGTKKTTKFALCSPTMFSTFVASLYILLAHGDNVRLSDVVKFPGEQLVV